MQSDQMFWLLLTVVVFVVIIWGVGKIRSDETSPSLAEDFGEVGRSLRKYVIEHRIVFLLLVLPAVAFFSLWANIWLIVHPKGYLSPFSAGIEDLALALSAGFFTAFVIFLLTDFAAKRAHERGFESLRHAFSHHAATFDDLFKVASVSGLRAFPKILDLRMLPDAIFRTYVKPGDVVRAAASAGGRWMQIEANNHTSHDRLMLPVLCKLDVKVRLLVHSALAEIVETLRASEHRTPMSPNTIVPLICQRKARLSTHYIVETLRLHRGYQEALNELPRMKERHKKFHVEIRVAKTSLNSDFFTVGTRCVFAAYPMANRLHQQAISVTVRDQLFVPDTRTGVEQVTKCFVDEFDHFWQDAQPYDQYMSEYNELILALLTHPALVNDVSR